MSKSKSKGFYFGKIGVGFLIFALLPFSAGDTLAEKRSPSAPAEIKADKILIEKSKRRLSLMRDGRLLKSYKISLGSNPVGAKTEQGDGKTPEGNYVIDGRNPNSAYHLSLHISYPNAQDKERAKNLGVSPGGAIMIHGLPNGMDWLGSLQEMIDWTQGCIALSNSEIEEVWKGVPDGTEVEIKP